MIVLTVSGNKRPMDGHYKISEAAREAEIKELTENCTWC